MYVFKRDLVAAVLQQHLRQRPVHVFNMSQNSDFLNGKKSDEAVLERSAQVSCSKTGY